MEEELGEQPRVSYQAASHLYQKERSPQVHQGSGVRASRSTENISDSQLQVGLVQREF